VTEHGMAYSPRGLRSRSRGSSRGRNDPPGHTGKLCTGQSTTDSRSGRSHAGREMREARVALPLGGTNGGRRDTETVEGRSERCGWKSAHRGNSLAAYSTSCTVLRGSAGVVPAVYSPAAGVLQECPTGPGGL